MGGWRILIVLFIVAALRGGACAQEATVRPAVRVDMPQPVDSNSPAFWRDGRLFWFGSHGGPSLYEGPSQFGPWTSRETWIETTEACPHWIESVWPAEDGVLWAWYHAEPVGLLPGSTLTAPKVGAVVSFDGGATLNDLGAVLESGDPLDPQARNGYFAGGHGDFSVILDRDRRYFYFFFDNYGGATSTQGVCLARMAFADRGNPAGKVWKYFNGSWQEAGLGGRVTPIFPVKKSWAAPDPDAWWGPSVHWNTYLNCYVMLLNHAAGEPGWGQEGVYVSYCYDLSRPETWTAPRRILDKSQFSGWYYFYPQVMGLEADGTDRRAGRIARLYVNGVSKWEIEFVAPPAAPFLVEVTASLGATAVKAGEAVTLNVSAAGSAPFTYQWFKDGLPLSAATSPALLLSAATAADAGVYTVVVANALGMVTSNGYVLTVSAPPVIEPPVTIVARPEAFLSNLSVRAAVASDSAALSLGFVVASAKPKALALRAVGPSLNQFGVAGMANPRLSVFDEAATMTASNDDWEAADAGLFAAVGAFALPVGSADAARVVTVPAGPGTAVVEGTAGGVVLVEIYDPSSVPGSKIVNLSARGVVTAGNGVLIGGFNVTGSGEKRLLVRALGPQLSQFGVGSALDDPSIEVFENGDLEIGENDNWEEGLDPVFAATGALPLPTGSKDAALVVTARAGNNYTVIVHSASGRSGEALLEIYEAP